MVQGGGVDGRDSSGSGILLTESSDISRRIRSNLLKRQRENKRGNLKCTFISVYTSILFSVFVSPCNITSITALHSN